jgi:N-acetylneuraminate lyase
MTQTTLAGIFAALVTPLGPDGNVNPVALEKLLERVYSAGVDGVYVCGSTGEGMHLPEGHRRIVTEIVTRNSPPDKKVIVHVGARTLDVAERLAKHAEESHAAAISCIRAPGITHEEMLAWYKLLASSTGLPFLAYYFPASTGEPLTVDQLTEICEMPGVGGIKYTDYDLYKVSLLSRAGYRIFNGHDEVLVAGLLMGACGGIGSMYNLVPEWFVELRNQVATGDWRAARSTQDRINDMIKVVLRFPFPAAIKQILTWEGIDCGNAVAPNAGLSSAEQGWLRQSLAALDIFASV